MNPYFVLYVYIRVCTLKFQTFRVDMSTLQWIASKIQSRLKAKANNEINEVYGIRAMLITILYAFKRV